MILVSLIQCCDNPIIYIYIYIKLLIPSANTRSMNSEILDTNEENFTMEYTPPSPFSSYFLMKLLDAQIYVLTFKF